MEEGKESCTDCNCCMFPKCPKCGTGVLLPFSFKEDVFENWKCTECDFVLEKSRRSRDR